MAHFLSSPARRALSAVGVTAVTVVGLGAVHAATQVPTPVIPPVPAAAATLAPTPAATPSPTAAPTALPTAAQPVVITIPTPRPAPVVVATPPPAPPPAPTYPARNFLLSDDGSLAVGLTTYGDCTGTAAVPRGIAAIDTCMTDSTYFIGHNPGVFTPLMSFGVGTMITYRDGAGVAHRMRVVSVRDWLRANGEPPKTEADVAYQFQTCKVADGSVDRILDAVPA